MLRILASSLLVALSSASSCGDSTIPFSLQIRSDGQPVLGCARPTCFGWAPNGKPVSTTSAFYTVNNRADGFLRAGPESIPAFAPNDSRYFSPQAAVCDLSFVSPSCPAVNQWVGGISPVVNVSTYPTMLQCCALAGLMQSEDRGVASLKGGQIVKGGEVISSGGVQVAFDYISNVAKSVQADGTVQYEVSIRRMPCAGPYRRSATKKIQKTDNGAQAFQEPNVAVDEPVPLPNETPQNGELVLEEVIQEEAVELPPGTQFQQQPQNPTQTGDAELEEIIQEEAVQLPPGTQFQPQSFQPFQPQQFSALQPPPQPQFQQFAFPQPQVVAQPVQFAPVPQYYAPPVSFYGGQSQLCFSGDMTVMLLGGSIKRMDELKKKDWVLTQEKGQLQYEPVEFWLHRVPDQEAEFNQFETEDGKTIKLTDKHFIYKGNCSRLGAGPIPDSAVPDKAVTADQISAGDCLYTVSDDFSVREVLVVRSSRITQRGIYAPMTTNGRIVVNGVHASCHNIMQSHSMAFTVFEPVDTLFEKLASLFGVNTDVVETPFGLSTILSMADLVVPKNLVTL